MKYLTLIRAIALLHQHQREVKETTHQGQRVRYLEVTRDDIATANHLAHEVLGRSLDELPPQTRRLLGLLDRLVAERAEAQGLDRADVRFTRREVREHTGWADFPVRTHLEKLAALEYVLVHRGGPGQRFVYELLWDGQGQEGEPFLAGLLDVERLDAQRYDENREGAVSPGRGPLEATPSIGRIGATLRDNGASSETVRRSPESTSWERVSATPSYVPQPLAAAAKAGAR
jgi:hypothetical protein